MTIRWEVRDLVGVAVIDRPERRNALDAQMCQDLHGYIQATPDLRAIVVGGSGDKAFCAGADLGRRAADTAGGLEHGGGDTFRPAFEALLDAIADYPAPVVAAVNGVALGAGMQLAVACDVRVVSSNAVFGIPAARLGVLLSPKNIARLALLVGQATARDVLLTARTLDIDDAERVGLVQRRADDALAAARTLASEIAELAPLSVSGHKHALNLLAERTAFTVEQTAEVARLEEAAFASRDLQEGISAFADKREPRFRGR